MIAKFDFSSSEFAAMAVWLDSKENGWRKYFLAQDKPVFEPKLVRLLRTRGGHEGNRQDVELEIPSFLGATFSGLNIRLLHYDQEDQCLWLGDGKKLPRHLRFGGENLFLIDPTPLIDSMFGAIIAGR